MKRLLTSMFAVALMLSLTACGPSEAVKAVDDKIAVIGTVSLQDEEIIIDAEASLASLSDKDKKKLENLQILLDARSAYNDLRVDAVEAVIRDIGTVTIEDEEPVLDAEMALEALPAELREEVDNLDDLEEARAAYNSLLLGAVESAITEIGIVTLRSGEAIDNARTAYDGLDKSLQDSVSNYDDLIKAEEIFLDNQIKDIEQAIRAIGTVTLSSQETIDKARSTYDKYDSEIQTAISNYDELVNAEDEIITVCTEHVSTLIEAIGTVNLDSAKAILAARSAYDTYSSLAGVNIDNVDMLVEAEEQLTVLRAENAAEFIAAIGTVTLDSKEAIDRARVIYEDLTAAEKSMVTNAEDLETAGELLAELQAAEEKRQEELRAAERDKNFNAALSRLEAEVDRVQSITWYTSRTQPAYINTRSYVLPYIGKPDSGKPILRWILNYTGDDWIFFEDVIFVVDGERTDKRYGYFDIERKADFGDIWEFIDVELGQSEIALLRKIVNSSETIVRFQGETYHYDLTVSSQDKAAIKDILTVYDRWAGNDGDRA